MLLHGSREPYVLRSDIDALKVRNRHRCWLRLRAPISVQSSDPALKAALDHAFEEPAEPPFRRTKAVVVVHDGRVIAERYAARNRHRHAAARVFHDQVGRQCVARRLDPAGPRHAFDAGTDSGMARGDLAREIEVEHLMRMTTGLALDETNIGFDPSEPDVSAQRHGSLCRRRRR